VRSRGTDSQPDPQEGDQPKQFIERNFELEQEGLGKAIESAHRLERKREPDARARPDEGEEVELNERALQAAAERPVQERSGPVRVGETERVPLACLRYQPGTKLSESQLI
jgi:hypothetical protein